jgi:hypothetical protein
VARRAPLASVLACLALAGPAAAAARAADVHGAAAPAIAPDCLGGPTVRPAEVVLACADDGLGVRAIVWLGWGRPVAAGVGIGYANDCSPSCAAGHVHTYRAVLLLSGTQRYGGRTAYRTATVAVVGAPPRAWQTVAGATYPLRCTA